MGICDSAQTERATEVSKKSLDSLGSIVRGENELTVAEPEDPIE